jgi:hypothetical protein
MERTQIFDLMSALKLFGMRTADDDVMAAGIKRQHEPPHIVGDLLKAEITEKQARSIKYQMTIAKLPLAKDIDDFDFDGTTVNETLVRDLAGGGFVAQQRNVVSSAGTAKTLVEALGKSGKIRRGGRIVDLPIGRGCREVDFGRGPKRAMPIPWGDVASAYYTTGIPNITVFTPISSPLLAIARLITDKRVWLHFANASRSDLARREDRENREGAGCIGA